MIAQQAGLSHSQKAAFGRLWPVAAATLLFGCCILSPALASSAWPPGSAAPILVSATIATKTGSCICRALGIDHELGTTICLRGPKGPRMAQCVMVLNNTSWKFSDAPCALASVAERPATLSHAGTRSLSLALRAR